MNEDKVLWLTSKSDKFLEKSAFQQSKAILKARADNEVVTLRLSYTDLEAIVNSDTFEEMENGPRVKEQLLKLVRSYGG